MCALHGCVSLFRYSLHYENELLKLLAEFLLPAMMVRSVFLGTLVLVAAFHMSEQQNELTDTEQELAIQMAEAVKEITSENIDTIDGEYLTMIVACQNVS